MIPGVFSAPSDGPQMWMCAPPSQGSQIDAGSYADNRFHLLFVCLFWPHHEACGILAPRPGIEPVPSAVKSRSLNHWTAREFPIISTLMALYLYQCVLERK